MGIASLLVYYEFYVTTYICSYVSIVLLLGSFVFLYSVAYVFTFSSWYILTGSIYMN